MKLKVFLSSFRYERVKLLIDSETKLEREYGDLTMLVRPDMRRFKLLDFLFEFKYISLKTLDLTAEQIRPLDSAALMELPLVKAQLKQANRKLSRYRKTLQKKYGGILQLHTYSVVAVGYQRLIWVEI